jgi:hypothetical protein
MMETNIPPYRGGGPAQLVGGLQRVLPRVLACEVRSTGWNPSPTSWVPSPEEEEG